MMTETDYLGLILKELKKHTELLESIENQIPSVTDYESTLDDIKGEIIEMRDKLQEIVINTANQ